MNSNHPDMLQQYSSGQRQPQRMVQQQQSRNFKPSNSISPTALQRQHNYQQQQQLSLPAVNQSRSERSLENSSGGYNIGVVASQLQRANMGALTARAGSGSQTSAVPNQQMMMPSNFTNQGSQAFSMNTQNEKIKSYSRKLARLVQSGVSSGGGGTNSTSRTPNGKKKLKTSQIGLASTLTQQITNPQSSLAQALRSGSSTGRGAINPNMIAAAVLYQPGGRILNSARSNLNLTKGGQNQTIDIEEQIKSMMLGQERKKSQNALKHSHVNLQGSSASYLHTNISQLIGASTGANGSKTARNQAATYAQERSPPSHGQPLSPTERNQQSLNQVLYTQNPGKSKENRLTYDIGTIFSNFANNSHYFGSKKTSQQQSHSLGKKQSYQGLINTQSQILIPKNSGSISRKRGSTKKDSFQVQSKNSQSRVFEHQDINPGQRSLKTYDEGISIRKKRASIGIVNQNQAIPSNTVANYAKKAMNQGSKTQRGVNNSSIGRGQNVNLSSQYALQQAQSKQNWFSPSSSNLHATQNISLQSNPVFLQQVLSSIDNNTQAGLVDKTTRTSQFVSPRSFMNKSGSQTQGNVVQSIQQQQPRMSIGDRNPLLISSYDDIPREATLVKFSQSRFVRNFTLRRCFRLWKLECTRMFYNQKRKSLLENILQGKSQSFTSYHRKIMAPINIINQLTLMPNIEANIKVFNESVSSIKQMLESFHGYILKSNNEYERRLSKDNRQDSSKKSLDHQITQRCQNFDKFIALTIRALHSSLIVFLDNNQLLNPIPSKLILTVSLQKSLDSSSACKSDKYQLETHPQLRGLSDIIKTQIEDSERLVLSKKVSDCFKALTSFFIDKQNQRPIDIVIDKRDAPSKERKVAEFARDVREAENLVKRMEELKQIIQFSDRWQSMHEQHNSLVADVESNYETWGLMEKFQHMLTQVPNSFLSLQFIALDVRPLHAQLRPIPPRIMQTIEKQVAAALESDTLALIGDLNKAYEILEQPSDALAVFVEQVNTVKLMKETMAQINTRHDSIQKLSLLCRSDKRLGISQQIQVRVKQLQTQIDNLPALLKQCEERLAKEKPQMEIQMRQSCQSLSVKIHAFEMKYIEHYIEDHSKLNDPQQTISEIKYRQKMIDDIKSKVTLYRECMSVIESKIDSTCFEDYEGVEKLHTRTLQMWQIIDQWKEMKSALLSQPFMKVDMMEISAFLEEAYAFISTQDPVKEKTQTLAAQISKEMSDIHLSMIMLKGLKRPCIRKRHWQMIFKELGLQTLQGKEDFTLLDLMTKAKIYSFQTDIQCIIKLAEKEYDYERQLIGVKQQMTDFLQFKLAEYKSQDGECLFVLSEFDIVQGQLEEFQVMLKKGSKSEQIVDYYVKDGFEQTLKEVERYLSLIEKVLENQKTVLSLDAIFSQQKLKSSLKEEHRSFLTIRSVFASLMQRLKTDPRLHTLKLNHSEFNQGLEAVSNKGTLVQKAVEDYVEAKRLAFPRFFFMTDAQFLEFIDLAENNKDFNSFINLLFPGVARVFLDQPLQASLPQQKVPPPMINDLSQVKSEFIDIKGRQGKSLANQKGMKPTCKGELDNIEVFKSNALSEREKPQMSSKPSQVMGFVSSMKELFLFEKKVNYQQSKPEIWLQNAETSMQETIGKLINYAVNTFPKQSLDEWILDYPQQVILSTIHLILTHEINELFEEMRKDKDGQNRKSRKRDYEDGEDSEDDYTGMTHKTPDTRDLIKNSQFSHITGGSQHISQKSSVRFLARKDEEMKLQGKQRISSQQQNSRGDQSSYSTSQRQRQFLISGEGAYRDLDQLNDDFTESEMDDVLDTTREKKRFAANMFGQDFDINLVVDQKDDTMQILQGKSFRGLYLRLQFWINQICKSLDQSRKNHQSWLKSQEKLANNDQTSDIKLELNPVHKLIMQTIINFLTYMRDVVYELKTKKVDNIDDFDWQKQMRLTWNGKELGCKVDCGAWTTQQGNEYYGAQSRIPLTPLTNKYFVFISAAFREKSAVLFRCVPTHDYCGDVFQEFSTICSVPFKQYHCNPKFSMKSLMQFLNGAALASVWIFFEHVDKLDYVHLQTFNKEIQMVQQQFIIAELSQDSSVITAHITVGNQSISQCQRSIERIREQASIEEKKQESGSKKQKLINMQNIINVGRGGGDIKIEDNIGEQDGDFDDNLSPSKLEEDDSLDLDNNPYYAQGGILKRQSNHNEIQSKNKGEIERHNHMLQNLTDLEIDEDGNVYQANLIEELKLDEQNHTVGEGHASKQNQNKICFGVFASISHQFNLKTEKWATEVSTALQSAFRVLSLTRPELSMIITMLLKSEGFYSYKELGSQIYDCITKMNEILNLSDRDDYFSITVRDIKRLIHCSQIILDQRLENIINTPKQKNQMMIYNMELKSKSQLLKDQEEEDAREKKVSQSRKQVEMEAVAYVIQLFLMEKLQSYKSVLNLNQEKIETLIKNVVKQVFMITVKKSEQAKKTKDHQLQTLIESKGLSLSKEELDNLSLILKHLKKSKPISVVGNFMTGKSTYINLIAKDLLKKRIIHFNPNVIGNYRDLYGIYDPFTTTQQTITQQIGGVAHSIFSVLKNEISKDDTLLLIEGSFDPFFSETLLPYLEHHQFKESEEDLFKVTLPNGIQENLKLGIPIVYELQSLQDASPRFIGAMQIINTKEKLDMKQIGSFLKARLLKSLQSRVQSVKEQCVQYAIDDLLLPTLAQLKKQKLLLQDTIVIAKAWLRLMLAGMADCKSLQNLEMIITKLTIQSIAFAIGCTIKEQGRQFLDEVFQGLKQQMGIQGSILNYYFDTITQQMVEMNASSLIIDNNVIINQNLIRAVHYSRQMLKHGKNFTIVGSPGTQKTTLVRYLLKNYQHEICGKTLMIPSTCFLTSSNIGRLLRESQKQKSCLIVIDDINVMESISMFQISEYLRISKANNFSLFQTDSPHLVNLSNPFHLLYTRNQCDTAAKENFYYVDDESDEHRSFAKTFISSQLQCQPTLHSQLSAILLRLYDWLVTNKSIVNVSSLIGLQSMHAWSQLIRSFNSRKEGKELNHMIFDIKACITSRILHPEQRGMVYEHVASLIKAHVPNLEKAYSAIDIDNLKEDECHDQDLSALLSNLRRPHTSFMVINAPGSNTLKTVSAYCKREKIKVVEPNAQKYRDTHTFIESLNDSLIRCLKHNDYTLILIKDSILNDIGYIDYIVNLTIAFKDTAYFNSLDCLIGSQFKKRLINIAKEQQQLQISHSPHSGLSSSASPSSFVGQSNDSQLLEQSLARLSSLVHFMIDVQSIKSYVTYVSSFPQLECLFRVHFITCPVTDTADLYHCIQSWAIDYTANPTVPKAFNNRVAPFNIPQTDCIFDSAFCTEASDDKVSQELSLSVPRAYFESEARLEQLKAVHVRVKEMLSRSLALQQQFYQKYFDQYRALHQALMKKILTKEQASLKHQSHLMNLLSMQEKIDKLQQKLKHRDKALKLLEKEKLDLMSQIDALNQEVGSANQQYQQRLDICLTRLRSITPAEWSAFVQQRTGSQPDQDVIRAFEAFLKSKKTLTSLTLNELVATTQIALEEPVSEQLVQKYLKTVQKRISQGDQSIVALLAKTLNEVFRGQARQGKLAQPLSRLGEMKQRLSVVSGTVSLYREQMAELKEEAEDMLIKEKNMKQEMKDVLKKVDLKELKQLRNDHKLKSLVKFARKSEGKLDKIKIRLKNLEGDSLILAFSVVFAGPLSVGERMEARKKLAEKLLTERNIESSEQWLTTSSEQAHCKYFKKVVQADLGLNLLADLGYLFVDGLFAEFAFTFIMAPTLPVVYDAVGVYQQELTARVFEEVQAKAKVLFTSDYMIESKLKSFLGADALLFLNDLNDYGKLLHGKCLDQPLLHRLPALPLRLAKRLLPDNEALSLPQLALFSASSAFNLGGAFLGDATLFNATFVNKNEAWIEIKQILLKHFLPDNYQKLAMIKGQLTALKQRLHEKQKAFDQLVLQVQPQAVEERDHKALEEVRDCYAELRQLDDDCQQYNQAFHNLINEHPLLASYSNIFVILFFALKALSRFTDEITYSWKIYTKVIDMIIAKIIRDLTMNLKNKEGEEDSMEEGAAKKEKEFTIDEEFFHSVIMPSIYATVVAGVKQEHVALFNLVFALEIALKKTSVAPEDKDFFVAHFFRIRNCYDWRLNPHKPSTIPSGFVSDPAQRLNAQAYTGFKREILRTYPELRRLFETIEIKIGKEFSFKEAHHLLYQRLFKTGEWKDLALIKKINVGFLCPDDEWRSKVCQFVYEELTTIFDFTEDLNKLHNFIKTASWSLPVALFTSNSINIVNTVCSIASYYGVGLEVLRTDYQQSIKKHEAYYRNKAVDDNLASARVFNDPDLPLSYEAACVHYELLGQAADPKAHHERMLAKDELEIDDKQITQNQSSMQLIEKCAENGTWVLISTLKFPSFWYKISRRLEKMARKGKVLNTFRLFFDLQGYSLQEIPEAFLHDHCVKFFLTEKNNEDMEGFNDVWANILNDDLLNAKDLHNVPVLEAPSDMGRINLNLQSNIIESSMDSLVPASVRDQKAVKEDKITYSVSGHQSKDTIVLPQIFTPEHMADILGGGKDLMSPKHVPKIHKVGGPRGSRRDEEISEIHSAGGHNFMSSGIMSGEGQTLLMMGEDMSGGLLSELNQAFARKMSSQASDKIPNPQMPKYEMVKKNAPGHKRQPPQLPQKH